MRYCSAIWLGLQLYIICTKTCKRAARLFYVFDAADECLQSHACSRPLPPANSGIFGNYISNNSSRQDFLPCLHDAAGCRLLPLWRAQHQKHLDDVRLTAGPGSQFTNNSHDVRSARLQRKKCFDRVYIINYSHHQLQCVSRKTNIITKTFILHYIGTQGTNQYCNCN